MDLSKITAGRDVPNEINVVIEIPIKGEPVKYEIHKDSGALFVDRFLDTAMFYPCNYGFVPQTLSEDGDPVDVLVVSPAPLMSGSVIPCRPIAMLMMTDESGPDAKILAVPGDKISQLYRDIKGPEGISSSLLDTISHFFEHYKDLEKGKWVKIEGWSGAEQAKAEIIASINRFKNKD